MNDQEIEIRVVGDSEAALLDNVDDEVGNAPARRLYESTGGIADEDLAVVYVYPLAEGTDGDE